MWRALIICLFVVSLTLAACGAGSDTNPVTGENDAPANETAEDENNTDNPEAENSEIEGANEDGIIEDEEGPITCETSVDCPEGSTCYFDQLCHADTDIGLFAEHDTESCGALNVKAVNPEDLGYAMIPVKYEGTDPCTDYCVHVATFWNDANDIDYLSAANCAAPNVWVEAYHDYPAHCRTVDMDTCIHEDDGEDNGDDADNTCLNSGDCTEGSICYFDHVCHPYEDVGIISGLTSEECQTLSDAPEAPEYGYHMMPLEHQGDDVCISHCVSNIDFWTHPVTDVLFISEEVCPETSVWVEATDEYNAFCSTTDMDHCMNLDNGDGEEPPEEEVPVSGNPCTGSDDCIVGEYCYFDGICRPYFDLGINTGLNETECNELNGENDPTYFTIPIEYRDDVCIHRCINTMSFFSADITGTDYSSIDTCLEPNVFVEGVEGEYPDHCRTPDWNTCEGMHGTNTSETMTPTEMCAAIVTGMTEEGEPSDEIEEVNTLCTEYANAAENCSNFCTNLCSESGTEDCSTWCLGTCTAP